MADTRQTSKYRRLFLQLQDEITGGQLAFQQQLPTEEQLARRFGVSRITVRQALDLLERNSYIQKVQGKGSFVIYQKTQMQLNLLQGFSEEMQQKGMQPSTRLLEVRRVPAGEELADALGIEADEEIYRVVRLRLADADPMCIEALHVPAALCPALEEKPLEGSIYAVFRSQYGLRMAWANQQIEAGFAGQEDAAHLGVEQGAAALITTRTTYLDSGQPLEYVTSVYRGDRYRITARLEYGPG